MSGAGSEKDRVAEFTAFRKRMNERILAEPNQVVRRFFALDTQTYQPGALDVKTKELLGLVASLVLRCDDCISYHVAQCREAGVSISSIVWSRAKPRRRPRTITAEPAGPGRRPVVRPWSERFFLHDQRTSGIIRGIRAPVRPSGRPGGVHVAPFDPAPDFRTSIFRPAPLRRACLEVTP
jgi:AhpD family alkylhydroperoxidase